MQDRRGTLPSSSSAECVGLDLFSLKTSLKISGGRKTFQLCSEQRDKPGKDPDSISGK